MVSLQLPPCSLAWALVWRAAVLAGPRQAAEFPKVSEASGRRAVDNSQPLRGHHAHRKAKPQEQKGRLKVATDPVPSLIWLAHFVCQLFLVFTEGRLGSLCHRARRNTGWRSCTDGCRQGGISGSKAQGRQSRRKANDRSDEAKRLLCHLCVRKELMKKEKGVLLPEYLWIRTKSLLIFAIHSFSEQIGAQQNDLELLSSHCCYFPIFKRSF